MRSARGRWLLGSKGIHSLSEVGRAFRKRALTENGQGFSRYQPWMASKQSAALARAAKLDLRFSPRVVSSPADLDRLNGCFHESTKRPFGKIDPTITQFRIAVSNSPEVARFEVLTHRALEILRTRAPKTDLLFSDLVKNIIPLGPSGAPLRPHGSGSSGHWFWGGVFSSPPDETCRHPEIEHAINLVHEMGHQSLILYQSSDRIVASDPYEQIYSPIRKTLRPVIMSFHAVVALAHMVSFLNETLINPRWTLAERSYLLTRRGELLSDLSVGLSSLSAVRFTRLGEEMRSEIAGLLSEVS